MRRILNAAADGTMDYPVSPFAAIYRRVPVLKPGVYFPGGVSGKWTVDEAYMQELATTYDPFFYAATVNCDHDRFWGPALGIVLALAVEGGMLYADVAIVDSWLAEQIDRGSWPHRSVEWSDEDLTGYRFYDRFPRYFTGLGLLGVQSPAVPELGPMPAREPDLNEEVPPEPRYYAYPLAASTARRHILSLAGDARSNPTPPEVPMPPQGTGNAPKAPLSPAQAPPGAEDAAVPAAERDKLLASVEALTKERDDYKAQHEKTLEIDVGKLSDQLSKLSAEVEGYRTNEAMRSKAAAIDSLVAGLKREGYIVPANEESVRMVLDAVHGNTAATEHVVKTLKVGGPLVRYGEIAKAAPGEFDMAAMTPDFAEGLKASGFDPKTLTVQKQGGA